MARLSIALVATLVSCSHLKPASSCKDVSNQLLKSATREHFTVMGGVAFPLPFSKQSSEAVFLFSPEKKLGRTYYFLPEAYEDLAREHLEEKLDAVEAGRCRMDDGDMVVYQIDQPLDVPPASKGMEL